MNLPISESRLKNDRIKLKENKSRILDEARREAKILVMDAKDEANSIIRDLEKCVSKVFQTAAILTKRLPQCVTS